MDYVEGSPIDKYCDSRKLSVDQRLRLFGKVCEAVQHAHQKLVIHRDLKPGNILVTADGVPKLLDFGIAKVLEPTEELLALTQASGRCMTPAYASPEQVRSKTVRREYLDRVLFWTTADLETKRKCCNFENADGNRPEMNSVWGCQAGRSNNFSMN
jgi:serine/threonine protein kinase